MELIDQYTYRVFWSEEDRMFIGACSKFAALSHLDESPAAALSGIREVVREGVAVLQAEGEEPPVPLSAQNFSGKFTVRGVFARRDGALFRLSSAVRRDHCKRVSAR